MLASNDFQTLGLGPNAKGKLTISAAMAVYPYDAQSVEGLIDAADHELMFNAKVSGKNCLRIAELMPSQAIAARPRRVLRLTPPGPLEKWTLTPESS